MALAAKDCKIMIFELEIGEVGYVLLDVKNWSIEWLEGDEQDLPQKYGFNKGEWFILLWIE